MQIFEIYFNPKKENCIAETFHYKPKSAYESKIGRVYLLGEIVAPEKKDAPFLQNLFFTLRENFYKDSSILTEKALQSTLLKVNSFIREHKKRENLNIAIIASKNFSILASKIGDVKIFLISRGKIIDIGKEVEDGDFNFFDSIVVEKMKKNDKLIILSSEIYSFFVENKILQKVANESLGEDIAKKISAFHKENFPEIFGVAIIIDHSTSIKEEGEKTISEEEKKQFSFKKIVKKSFPLLFIKKRKKTKEKKEDIKFKPKPPLSLKKMTPSLSIKSNQKKAILLITSLVFVVAIGSLMIGIERNLNLKSKTEEVELLKEKIISITNKEDFFEMKQLFEEIELIKSNPSIFTTEIEGYYNDLREKLLILSLSENAEEVLFIKEIEKINPEKIAFLNNKLYFAPQKESLFMVLNLVSHIEETYDTKVNGSLGLISSSSNGILLFSPPNFFIRAQDSTIGVEEINLPGKESKFISLSSFLGRPYFLDDNGEIFTYTTKNHTRWINEDEKKAEGGISIAIDGSLYVLTKSNQILHYYRGNKEKEITVSVFPKLENADKIITTPESPLLILDSKEQRIIVINKEGKLVKQVFHEKFKNIKDMTLSSDGKKIYLLINKEVYSLEI